MSAVIEVWQIFTCVRGYENNTGIPGPCLIEIVLHHKKIWSQWNFPWI